MPIDYNITTSAKLYLGHVGENGSRRFKFDISKWIKHCGTGGTAHLLHKRYGDDTSYEVTTTQEDNYVYWIVSTTDVANVGTGSAELQYIIDDNIVKSETFITVVKDSLSSVEGETPTAIESWIDTLTALESSLTVTVENMKTTEEELNGLVASAQEYSAAAAESATGASNSAASAIAIAQSVRDDADAGLFKGDKGDKGDSYTITAADYQAIAEQVDGTVKQDKLVSGENIKTINNESILGKGNIAFPVIDVRVNNSTIVNDNKVANIDLASKQDKLSAADKQAIANLHSDAVTDVRVNGVSDLANKIANITIEDNSTIGQSFTANATVGNLLAGTEIAATDSLATIVYNMLYRELSESEKITVIFGGADSIPTSISDINSISHRTVIKDLTPNILVAQGLTCRIITGNETTEEGQFAVIAVSTSSSQPVKISSWAVEGAGSIGISFATLTQDGETYTLYFLNNATYDADGTPAGTNYTFTFKEA